MFQILREPRITVKPNKSSKRRSQYRLRRKRATCRQNSMKGFGYPFCAQVNRENRAWRLPVDLPLNVSAEEYCGPPWHSKQVQGRSRNKIREGPRQNSMANLGVAFCICGRFASEVERTDFTTGPHDKVGSEKFNEVYFTLLLAPFVARVWLFLSLFFFLFSGSLFPPRLLFADFFLRPYPENLNRTVMRLNCEVLKARMEQKLRDTMFRGEGYRRDRVDHLRYLYT